MDNHFKIITPCYNSERWVDNNANSVLLQTYKNYHWLIADDMSTDNTYPKIKNVVEKIPNVTLINNTVRKFPLGNIHDMIAYAKPKDEDIIVILDGDDWFATKYTLEYVNNFYKDKNCWITYGSFIQYPQNTTDSYYMTPYPDNIINTNSFRNVNWKASHLRTFKYNLWKRIKKEDLIDPETNKFYNLAGDLAATYPMLEMAGNRSEYISEIIYVYNAANPLNEMKIDGKKQLSIAARIKSRQKYTRIEKL